MEPSRRSQSGQSLIEVVIGIGIGVLFITGALGIIMLALRLDFENKFSQAASELAQSITEQVITVANDDWHAIDGVPHGTSFWYNVTSSSLALTGVSAGHATTTVDGRDYTTFFTIEDVSRDVSNKIVTDGGGTVDPSTLKINATVRWQNTDDTGQIVFTSILTRNRDRVWAQTDWSGGEGVSGPVTTNTDKYFSAINVATTTPAGAISIKDLTANLQITPGTGIDPVFRYAWSDVIGWIDFYHYGTVAVGTTITGYASSSVGQIALDCGSTPNGDICLTSNFAMSNNSGTVGGHGWNDMTGWIRFAQTSTPPLYGVTIDGSGDFHGWAWSDVVGWICFNGLDGTSCPPGANYKVKTGSGTVSVGELISSTFDTSRNGGAAWNTMIWQGPLQPAGTSVGFQIATSPNSTGPWLFVGPAGIGDATDYYSAPRDSQILVPRLIGNHNNTQYLRYKVLLFSNASRTASPTVEDIYINWSL